MEYESGLATELGKRKGSDSELMPILSAAQRLQYNALPLCMFLMGV